MGAQVQAIATDEDSACTHGAIREGCQHPWLTGQLQGAEQFTRLHLDALAQGPSRNTRCVPRAGPPGAPRVKLLQSKLRDVYLQSLYQVRLVSAADTALKELNPAFTPKMNDLPNATASVAGNVFQVME